MGASMLACGMAARSSLVWGMAFAAAIGPAYATTFQTLSFQTLYSFGANGAGDGSLPSSGVVMDADGALYGTSNAGGAFGNGTVYQLAPPAYHGAPWTESVLYSFAGGTADGAAPVGVPVLDAGGNLYGTTMTGGASGFGTVFKLSPSTGGTYTESVIYSFTGAKGGATPVGGLIADLKGAFYGATQAGGAANQGTVFQIIPKQGGTYAEKALYVFAGGSDGASPTGALVSKSGALFGTTTSGGGSTNCSSGCGTVFKLTPEKGGYQESILYAFQGGKDGADPGLGLFMDFDGSLYGTTVSGGSANAGTVFKLSQRAGGIYEKTVLCSFKGGATGGAPVAPVFLSDDSELYGTTASGGTSNDGTIYSLVKHSETVLYNFSGSDGGLPNDALISPLPGVLYGTTAVGGANNAGTVFALFIGSDSVSKWPGRNHP